MPVIGVHARAKKWPPTAMQKATDGGIRLQVAGGFRLFIGLHIVLHSPEQIENNLAVRQSTKSSGWSFETTNCPTPMALEIADSPSLPAYEKPLVSYMPDARPLPSNVVESNRGGFNPETKKSSA